MKHILIIVDVQNDFCPGGSLAVSDGEKIIPGVNTLSADNRFSLIVATQDWHSAGHLSFASSHGKPVLSTIPVSYGDQMLWPDHCVQGTRGAEFHPLLDTRKVQVVLRKGFRKEIDSYSGFFENDKKTSTGLFALIDFAAAREPFEVVIVGIATDVCVFNTAMDARQILRYERVTVITDACAGVTPEGVATALSNMQNADVRCITLDRFLREKC